MNMKNVSKRSKAAVINQLLSKWKETACIFKVSFNKIHLIVCTLEPSLGNGKQQFHLCAISNQYKFFPLPALAPWLMRKWNVFWSK